jgi:hypothetical protein
VAHLLKSPIEQVKGNVNVKSSPQANLSRIKVSSSLEVKLNKEKIIFAPKMKLLQ